MMFSCKLQVRDDAANSLQLNETTMKSLEKLMAVMFRSTKVNALGYV